MTKHRSFFLFFSMLLLGLLLAACGAGAAPTAETPAASSAPDSASQPEVAANAAQTPQIIEFYTDW